MEDYEIRRKLSEIKTLLEEKTENPLTLNEAAEYLKVSQANLYRLTSHKLIPFYKPAGKLIYFFKRELDRWITKNEESIWPGRDEVKSDVKDPHQIEMEIKDIGDRRLEAGDRKIKEEELVIEFPLKSIKEKERALNKRL